MPSSRAGRGPAAGRRADIPGAGRRRRRAISGGPRCRLPVGSRPRPRGAARIFRGPRDLRRGSRPRRARIIPRGTSRRHQKVCPPARDTRVVVRAAEAERRLGPGFRASKRRRGGRRLEAREQRRRVARGGEKDVPSGLRELRVRGLDRSERREERVASRDGKRQPRRGLADDPRQPRVVLVAREDAHRHVRAPLIRREHVDVPTGAAASRRRRFGAAAR